MRLFHALIIIIIVLGTSYFLTSFLFDHFKDDVLSEIINAKMQKTNIFSNMIQQELNHIGQMVQFSSIHNAVKSNPHIEKIQPEINGIPENIDLERRNIGKELIRCCPEIYLARFTIPNGDTYLMEPYSRQLTLSEFNAKDAQLDWFRGVTEFNTLYFSEVFTGFAVKENTLVIANPVYSNDTIIGIWSVAVNLNFMKTHVEESGINHNTRVLVIDHTGSIVLDSFEERTPTKITVLDNDVFLQPLSGRSGSDTIEIEGVKNFIVYTPVQIGNHVWGIVTLEPYSSALSLLYDLQLELIIINVSAFTIVFFMLSLLLLKSKQSKESKILEEKRKLEQQVEKDKTRIQELQKLLLQTQKKEKRNNISLIIVILLLGIVGVYIYYDYQPESLNLTEIQKLHGKIVIQNLIGDIVETWTYWNIPPEKPIYLKIINSELLSPEQIKIVKDSILSENVLEFDGKVIRGGQHDQKYYFYEGWKGALTEASKKNTEFTVPTNLKILENNNVQGDINIIFTNEKNPDGYSGFTKMIVDGNRILKIDITIYEIKKITNPQVGIILRHELGHAFGLVHSTDPDDLMHEIITTGFPYISECDLAAIIHLYDGGKDSHVVCEK